MRAVGDKQIGSIRPEFDRSSCIDFQGAKMTGETCFLLIREVDQRFNTLGAAAFPPYTALGERVRIPADGSVPLHGALAL